MEIQIETHPQIIVHKSRRSRRILTGPNVYYVHRFERAILAVNLHAIYINLFLPCNLNTMTSEPTNLISQHATLNNQTDQLSTIDIQTNDVGSAVAAVDVVEAQVEVVYIHQTSAALK